MDQTFVIFFVIWVEGGILRVDGSRSPPTIFPPDDLSCFVNVSNLKNPARSITYFEFVSEIMEEDARNLQFAIPVFFSLPAPAFLLKFLLHALRGVKRTSLLQFGFMWGRFFWNNTFNCIANWRLSLWWCCRKCIRGICFECSDLTVLPAHIILFLTNRKTADSDSFTWNFTKLKMTNFCIMYV